ncbi:glucosidase 2 subunit beta-like [Gordionus sp. m RMFG-2023]|uniref:glucosidase 2 subunit beta-like n=1 Tax=Gordionus sp. m RMFG-2023 TaxID=3053472 RepID=UPI0031FCE686
MFTKFFFEIPLYLFSLFYVVKSQSLTRPIGVSVERSHLYANKDGYFYCFTDSFQIPYKFVNDDYCDCKDGSDEPGTSACRNGQFHCDNKGFIGKSIFSSWVNDGICDCCDGSDEHLLDTKCNNTCREEGQVYVAHLKNQIQINEIGLKIRAEDIKNGLALKHQRQEKLNQVARERAILKEEFTKIEGLKIALEVKEKQAKDEYMKMLNEIKEQMKIKEAKKKSAELFEKLDTNKNGILQDHELASNLLPLLTQQQDVPTEPKDETLNNRNDTELQVNVDECDYNSDSVVDRNDLNSVFENMKRFEMDAHQFYEHFSQRLYKCHPHSYELTHTEPPAQTQINSPEIINDHVTEPIQQEEQHLHPEDVNYPDHPQEHPHLKEDGGEIEMDDHQSLENEGGRGDDDDDEEEDIYPRDKNSEEVHTAKNEYEENEVLDGEEPSILPYDENTKALLKEAQNLRREFSELSAKHSNLDKEYSHLKRMDEMDTGPETEFSVLMNHCFEYKDDRNEYVYILCPFKDAVQKSISSGSQTSMGNWNSFETDENNDRYGYMLFSGGQQCWNGPNRSTKVKLLCGDSNKLVSVSEPSRCEYHMEFLTPSKCMPLEKREDLKPYLQHFRDEL